MARTNSESAERGHGFGTAPVFLAGISTILGAILFLRFGYAVGHVGLHGALLVVIIGHLITIPTALAVSEIATNQKVEGGGEYFIISRSFGTTLGGPIGIALYLSQTVSVAFYLLAFGEAFRPLLDWAASRGLPAWLADPRVISLPTGLLLLRVILRRGASMGISILWGVCAVLALSLISLFAGPGPGRPEGTIFATAADPDPFQTVFAICFPAFTGMTAGIGLSGDLKDPRWSIPVGTLAATVTGMLVYVAVAFKLAGSASPDALASDPLVMSRIALWGPLIPAGLAAATLSSAVGSLLIAPRTLQAIAADGILPWSRANGFLAAGRGRVHEPQNATLVSGAITIAVVALGSIDAVAQVISMFFMVTYGSLCGISFLEHFAGNPSYRPSFRTRWYISLFGATMCGLMMFQMSPVYALLALLSMHLLYLGLRASRSGDRDLGAIFEGVVFQLTRHLHVAAQKRYASFRARDWRPSFIMVSEDAFERLPAFDLLRWIAHRYGFATLIHYIPGQLSSESSRRSRQALARLIGMTETSGSSIFVDTVVSPSYTTALAQMSQVAGISGLENNCVLFDFPQDHPEGIKQVVDGCRLVRGLEMNLCVLRHTERRFGFRQKLHVWLTEGDEKNANLLILLAFIIAGHPDWSEAEISVFASFKADRIEKERAKLSQQILAGRLPISLRRLRVYPFTDEDALERQVERYSGQADLVLAGFDAKALDKDGTRIFQACPLAGEMLFVHATRLVEIM